MSQRVSDLEAGAINAADEVRALDNQWRDCKDRGCDKGDECEKRSLELFGVSRVSTACDIVSHSCHCSRVPYQLF